MIFLLCGAFECLPDWMKNPSAPPATGELLVLTVMGRIADKVIELAGPEAFADETKCRMPVPRFPTLLMRGARTRASESAATRCLAAAGIYRAGTDFGTVFRPSTATTGVALPNSLVA